MKVLVSDSLSQQGLNLLIREEDFEIDVKTDLTSEGLMNRIGDYDALIIRSTTKVTDDVIKAAKRLKVIGRALGWTILI